MSDWPHQLFAVQETTRRIDTGDASLCVTSPTGGGKSRIIQRLCEWAVAKGWQVAIFTNRKLLTAQLSRGLHESGIHLGVRAADFDSWSDPSAPVQVCSAPTETSRVFKARERAMNRLATEGEAHRDHRLFPAKLIIIDEVHMNCADQMMAIVGECREKFNSVVVGITATPLGVSHLLDDLIVAGNMTSLRECGALVRADCFEPSVFDLPKVYREKVELSSQKELDDAVRHIWCQHIVGYVFEHWKEINPDGKPALGMAPGVKEAIGLAEEFSRRGVNSASIDGAGIYINGEYYRTTRQEDRDDVFEQSRSGAVKIIWNRFALREAIDLPWLEHLILATPIASPLSYVQTVGRVMRASRSTGKTRAIITDHAGSIRMHGSPNMDRDEQWMQYFHETESKLHRDRQNKLRSEESEPEPLTCPKCGQMRKAGLAKCPNPECGFEHRVSVRQVIQSSGKLVPVKGDVYPRRRVKMKPNTVKLWEQCVYRCSKASKPLTFAQARGLFVRENHYWPPDGLPLMPKDERDWTRHIKAVPRESLH